MKHFWDPKAYPLFTIYLIPDFLSHAAMLHNKIWGLIESRWSVALLGTQIQC